MSYIYDVCHRREEQTDNLSPFSSIRVLRMPSPPLWHKSAGQAMNADQESSHIPETQKPSNIIHRLEEGWKECEYCRPLTPVACTKGCNTWNLRNEVRKLRGITRPSFKMDLMNTLKNNRRLRVLDVLLAGKCPLPMLQRELKKLGYHHSQQTIVNEYVNPLIQTGLVEKNHGNFCLTQFGRSVSNLTEGLDLSDLLPPHSECNEEKVIRTISENPKTYEELAISVTDESLARTLKRLQDSNLMSKPTTKCYVYYFRSKRKPEKETLSSTERRIYGELPDEGTTAEDVSLNAGISLRRTYKYLRRLRGKKLAFRRKRPGKYSLTTEGAQIAIFLRQLDSLVEEYSEAYNELLVGQSRHRQPQMPDRKKREAVPAKILVRSAR